MKLLNSFFSGVISEFKQITWPNKKETTYLVKVVIIFSVAMAIFLGMADYGFSRIMQTFVLKI